MENFVGSVTDEPLRERLIISIDGKGAFRRFKDVLLAYPAERERWFSYRAELLHWHIQQLARAARDRADATSRRGARSQPPQRAARGRPPGRPRHRGAGRGAAPAGARSDRDDPGDRAADRDRVPRVPEAAQRRAARERRGRSTIAASPSTTTSRRDARRDTTSSARSPGSSRRRPTLDAGDDRRAARRAARAIGSPLALAIARIVELVAEQLVDPGIALPRARDGVRDARRWPARRARRARARGRALRDRHADAGARSAAPRSSRPRRAGVGAQPRTATTNLR